MNCENSRQRHNEAMTELAPKAMSEAEYLLTERQSPYKREYVGGFVYPLHAQAGASGNHVQISGNIFGTLFPVARRQGCRLYQSDMKLYAGSDGAYFYPDVMLVCGGERPDPYFETAPCLLVEVLSGSTADNDRRHKRTVYSSVASVQTYLLVSQAERHVVEYQRVEGEWQMRQWQQEGRIAVPCLNTELTLEDIYGGVLR